MLCILVYTILTLLEYYVMSIKENIAMLAKMGIVLVHSPYQLLYKKVKTGKWMHNQGSTNLGSFAETLYIVIAIISGVIQGLGFVFLLVNYFY